MDARTGSDAALSTETLVIGAGPAGLAVSACLRKIGRPFVLLEQADAVGSSWRNHYERLHLHTVKEHSGLPFLPFPDDVPRYPSRADVVAYLDTYARTLDLRPRFGERVVRATPSGAGFHVETERARFDARNLVVATSYNGEPHIPEWPDQGTFAGRILHSREYKNGAPFRDKDVLVVGIGNSGGEIAIDLVEHGARTGIVVRGPVHVMPRDALGVPAQKFGLFLSKLPLVLADRIGLCLARLFTGDLSRFGLQRPTMGPASQVVRLGRIPLIDIGTIDLIRRGRITVVPEIARFEATGVVLRDGSKRKADAIVLATGFRPRLDRFLPCAADVTDERGYPRIHGEEVRRDGIRGLYFLGFRNPITGMLREIHLEALRIARSIARDAT